MDNYTNPQLYIFTCVNLVLYQMNLAGLQSIPMGGTRNVEEVGAKGHLMKRRYSRGTKRHPRGICKTLSALKEG